MGVPNYQLTTNFSANCQLTTIFLANCQLTTNFSYLLTFIISQRVTRLRILQTKFDDFNCARTTF